MGNPFESRAGEVMPNALCGHASFRLRHNPYGCNQHYDMGHGYYVMREGAFEDATNKQPCADCSHFLYMAKRGATMPDTVWLCANEGCPSNKRKT
jgi:hypothetical protein